MYDDNLTTKELLDRCDRVHAIESAMHDLQQEKRALLAHPMVSTIMRVLNMTNEQREQIRAIAASLLGYNR